MNRRGFLARGAGAAGLMASSDALEYLRSPADAGPPGAIDSRQPDATLHARSESAYIRSASQGKSVSWFVGNGFLERVIKFSPTHGLYTEKLENKISHTDFVKDDGTQRGSEFIFQADSSRFLGAVPGPFAHFDLVASHAQDLTPPGKLLEVQLRAKQKALEVSAYYAVYSGHPVIRKWIAITNRGNRRITVSHLAFEALSLKSGPPSEEILRAHYGVEPREIFFTGRVEDTAILQMNPRTQEGFIVMNEAPGWMKRTEMAEWGKGVQVMYDTDLFPFERSVKPGETFTSAKCGLALFVSGLGMADPRWSVPTYTSEVLMKKGAGYRPVWFYNTWEPFFQDYDERTVLESIPIAARMALDVFTLDTGWGKSYADNEVDAKKFPRGLAPIRKAVEDQGMRLGLWEPLAVVSRESKVYREHAEWVIRDRDGNEKGSDFPSPSDCVMCLDSPYRDSAAARIQALIGEHNLRYVKIDLTTVFNAYGEAPGCYAKGHYHRDWAESLGGIYESIKYVTDRIYQAHPDVLLDLTFELWGQKHVLDYGLLAAGDLDWTSNVADATVNSAGPRQARTLLYARCMALPAETMLIGNLRATTPAIEERFGTAVGSAPVLLGDLRQLSSGQVKWYAEKIAWFKELRQRVSLNEGFFPLGDWQQPKCTTWDGFARLSRQGEGIIVIFKNESGIREVRVRIPTYPTGQFSARSIMSGDSLGHFSEEQLRRGAALPVPPRYKVQIVEIRRR